MSIYRQCMSALKTSFLESIFFHIGTLLLKQSPGLDKSGVQAVDWINRARKDREAINVLKLHDKALSIYLLQQCIEKMVKALSLHSGKFTPERLKQPYGHDSKRLLVDLWGKIQNGKTKHASDGLLSSIFNLQCYSCEDMLATLEFVIEFQKSIKPSIQQISVHLEQNDTLSLVPHVNGKKYQYLFTYDQSNSGFTLIESPSGESTNELLNLTLKFILDSGISSIQLHTSSENDNKDDLRQILDERFLYFSVFFLAALTFSHENTSRYPREQGRPIGCQDYNDDLPVIKNIDLLNNICDTCLTQIEKIIIT